MTTRAEAKADTRRRLLEAARSSLRTDGPAALSLRETAKRAGIVPSAVYRHFDSRDALLTQLILDAYTGLAEALERAVAERPETGEPWRVAATALRAWALDHRHEFQLIYGTPVPGYVAPAETVGAAERVVAVFLAVAPEGSPAPASSAAARLQEQLARPAQQLGVGSELLAAVLADLGQLVGLLVLELGGHLVGTAEPADHLWESVLDAQQGRARFS